MAKPETLQNIVKSAIQDLLFLAVVNDECSEIVHYIFQHWPDQDKSTIFHQVITYRKCKNCLIRRAYKEKKVLFLTKLRRFCKPFQVLCYSSGIMAAKDLQWDFFKMIIPCRDQKILELKLGPEKDTILHLAVKANDPALIENMLVCYGIPTVLNLQNRDRKSVLELAVERGYAEVVRRLLHWKMWSKCGYPRIGYLFEITDKYKHHETAQVLAEYFDSI